MSDGIQRFTADHPCPVCGGSEHEPRGEGKRCFGFLTDDWIHCTREDCSPGCKFHEGSRTFSHRRRGACDCGSTHGEAVSSGQGSKKSGRGNVVAIYRYHDRDGKLLHETLRWQRPDGSKSFSQRRPDGNGGFITKDVFEEIHPVLYRLPELLAADPVKPVWIVEGEKDVDNLVKRGLVATCNVMGALKWRDRYAEDLRGRICYVIPDNDTAEKRFPGGKGRAHARMVAKSLKEHGATVKIVDLVEIMPGLAEKGDVSDFLAAGGTVEQLVILAEKTAEWEPPPPEEEKKNGHHNGNGNGDGELFKIETHADVLLRLTDGVEVFRTPSGDPWVSLPINGHKENHPATSLAVNRWLNFRFWSQNKKPCTSEAVQRIQDILVARACFEGDAQVEAQVRIGPAKGPTGLEFYVDMGNDKGQAVQVTAEGWEIVTNPAVKFRRPGGLGPLPEPATGAELAELWELLNLDGEDARKLVIAALTWAMVPGGPYPVIVVTGEQGSAKSTTCRLLKHVIDPSRPKLGSQPESQRDFMVIANSGWVFTVDNISKLPPWFSDSLSRLATGAGFQVRKHYSNDESQIFEATRPMILNGIEDFAHRADLLNRALLVTCPPIPDERRKEDKVLWGEFEKRHPRIFGAVLDAAVGAMKLHPSVELPGMIRMADFERWGEAVCRHLGAAPGEFSRIVRSNRDEATALVLEESPVAVELQNLRMPGGEWRGTCLDLLELLREKATAATRDGGGFPRTPRGLSGQLRRLAPAMRRVGVEVEFPGHRTRTEESSASRLFTITWRNRENSSGAPL